MTDLLVTIVQTDLVWEDVQANLNQLDEKLSGLSQSSHLILLPEMFTTGFTMNARSLAQTMDGTTVQWLREKAQATGANIAGSAIIIDEGKYYNRLLWARPNGELMTYDKRHLFRIYGEDSQYSPGSQKRIVELDGWKIAIFICYDLRFPVWSRNYYNQYDLAVYVANWPESRAYHWNALLPARAIENQAYVIGVNRVGKDGNGITYIGDSSVYDPRGNIKFRHSHSACIETVALSYQSLATYREKFPAWRDADYFEFIEHNFAN